MSEKTNSKNQSRRKFLRDASFASAFFIVPRHVLGRGFTAPSDKKNLAIIGCGKQSSGLANAFLNLPNVQMVAASDVFDFKMKRMQTQVNQYYANTLNKPDYNSCKGHKDFREILADKSVDAVIIASPDHWHAVMSVKACEAGKDVYCEKPLALTVAEGRAMVNAARKYKRVFQTGSMQRSWPEFRQAVELVRNGYIGDVSSVVVNIGPPVQEFDLPEQPLPAGLDWNAWLGPNEVQRPYHQDLAPDESYEKKIWPYWRKYADFGGGMITDWGAHMFDIAQWGMNTDETGPLQLFAPIAPEMGNLILKYPRFTMMHSLQSPGSTQYCRFNGSKGSLTVQRGKIITDPVHIKDIKILDSDSWVYFSDNHYADFIKCIDSRAKPICDVEIGHRTSTVCNITNIAYTLREDLNWDAEKEMFVDNEAANRMLTRRLKKEWQIAGV